MESQSLESQSVLTSSLSRFLFFPGAPLGLVASRGVSEYLPGPKSRVEGWRSASGRQPICVLSISDDGL
jgi:hypothetical protein